MSESQRLYDSRAVSLAEFRSEDWGGWERTEARLGVIYLRKHVSGPLNTDPGWTLVEPD